MNDINSQTSDLLRFYVGRVILSPKAWQGLSLPQQLKWTAAKLSSTKPAKIPSGKRGVYTFIVKPDIANHPMCGYLLYVGKAAGKEGGFRGRYRSYRAEKRAASTKRPRIARMIKTWYRHLWFYYAQVNDAHIDVTEAGLLEAYIPPMNTSFPATISEAVRAFP